MRALLAIVSSRFLSMKGARRPCSLAGSIKIKNKKNR